jgi:hypothetical protein
MKRRRLEKHLYRPVSRFFGAQGFGLQYPEMGFYEYRIDLFAFCGKRNQTIAIELKLTKWKRAFEQAALYKLCSDLVYIAVPETTVRRIDSFLLRAHGIGLISVGKKGDCKEIISASQSDLMRLSYRDTFIRVMKGN